MAHIRKVVDDMFDLRKKKKKISWLALALPTLHHHRTLTVANLAPMALLPGAASPLPTMKRQSKIAK